jgi:rhamnose transport system permease protein
MIDTLKRYVRPEQIRELSLVFLIIIIVFFFGSQIENYFSARTINRIAASVAIVAVVAVGQTLVVLTRNIDLSAGSIVGCTAYFVGTQLALNNDLPPATVILLAVGLGALLGLINGVLVAYGGIPAIITTLGTLAIYRSVLVEFSGAKTVTTDSLPTWIVDLPRTSLFSIGDFDLRPMVVLAIAIVIVFQLVLVYLPFGRRLYAIGSNPDAARFAGLPARRMVMTAYILCGALAGLAGFMFLARFGTITVVAAQGMELQVVAAVVVGGVNIFGGSGRWHQSGDLGLAHPNSGRREPLHRPGGLQRDRQGDGRYGPEHHGRRRRPVRHPLGFARRRQPERLDCGHERGAERPEVRQVGIGGHGLWQRPVGRELQPGPGAGGQVP